MSACTRSSAVWIKLIRHDPEPRLVEVRDGLRQALHVVRRDYTQLRQAADWLEQLAAILDPDGQPVRSAAEVQAEWQTYLDQIEAESQTSAPLQEWAAKLLKVSASYAPGLFYTYDCRDSRAPTMIVKASSAI
jgi:DNA repair ATPase RecN